jgi:AcrR family transcriptional regulator
MTNHGTESSAKPGRAALVERREAEIIHVARRVFARHGYRRTQIDKVAEALKVGKGTVYRYFGSKKKLFLAVANDAVREVSEETIRQSRAKHNPLDKIETAIRAQLEYIDRNPDIIEILMQERSEFRDDFKPTYLVYRDANLGQLEDILRQAVSRGHVRPVRVTQAANIICDLVYGVVMVSYMRKDRHLRDVCDDVVETLFQGLLTPAGQEARKAKAVAKK